MGAQNRAGENDVIDSEVRPTSGADQDWGNSIKCGYG